MIRTLANDTVNKIGSQVTLYGWAANIRDHGKIIFIDLRDRSGVVQTVYPGSKFSVHNEDVVKIVGLVKKRPEKMINPKMDTGAIEVDVKNLEIISRSQDLPFPIDNDGYEVNEEVRLKYRYLDLRRTRLTKNIRQRSAFLQAVREYLISQDFIEIETPLLTKSTPEGSRDFLVPSRLQPGYFYALPQSPQQYKQLLMVSGFERYFQIARCLRDEDLRADRGFEHTQIDLEMSFVEREEVMRILEDMIIAVFEKMGQKIKQKPFPVITYTQALNKFGSDKFDLRNSEEKKQNIKAFAWVVDFPFFKKDKLGNWTFTHNPFSSPKAEFISDLLKKLNIGNILTSQYDLVCNGFEVGGGSIRSNNPEVLTAVFEVMGYSKSEIRQKFGHILEAFRFGVPPHGGCAFGVERLMMILTNEQYLREVVAFPMNASGKTAIMDAPSRIDEAQLTELELEITTNENRKNDVFSKIILILKKNMIEHRLFEHKPVFTSGQAARARGTNIHQGAKALVMFADGKPLIIVLPADTKVDPKKFKSLYKINNLRMARPDEVEKITGVEIGAIPPFGSLFNLPLFVDKKIFENEEIVFNAGLHTRSIKIKTVDYQRIYKGAVEDFSAENNGT